MVEIILRKRRAQPGEVGLFLDTEIFIEEFRSLPMDAEVKAECTVPANLKYLRFFWALVGKVADNSPDGFLDKQDCADRILLEAKHFKLVVDNLRNKSELRVKSISGLSADTWIRLLRRVTDVVVMKFLPGMDRNVLKAEIEAMVGVMDTPDPEPKKRRQRAPKDNREEVVAGSDTGSSVETRLPPADSLPPEGRPEGSAKAPTNEAEYIQACMAWIKKQTNRHLAFDYFNGEVHRKMRMDLKISTGTRKTLERQIGEFFDEQDKASKSTA